MYSAFKFALIRYCENNLICDFEDLRYVPDTELVDEARKYLRAYINGLKKFTDDTYNCVELTERIGEQLLADFNNFISTYAE